MQIGTTRAEAEAVAGPPVSWLPALPFACLHRAAVRREWAHPHPRHLQRACVAAALKAASQRVLTAAAAVVVAAAAAAAVVARWSVDCRRSARSFAAHVQTLHRLQLRHCPLHAWKGLCLPSSAGVGAGVRHAMPTPLGLAASHWLWPLSVAVPLCHARCPCRSIAWRCHLAALPGFRLFGRAPTQGHFVM